MERMTRRYYQDDECDVPYVTSGIVNCGDCYEDEVINRLAEYEDTGLEPTAITALQKDYKIAKTTICEFCRKRSKEQNVLCGCAACKYGGLNDG